MQDYTLTNRALRVFAYAMLVIGVLGFLITGNTLTTTEPDIELVLSGGVIEGDEIPHPQRWLVAFGVLVAGVFNALILFAISEALCRLQDMAHHAEGTHSHVEKINYKASS